MIVFWCDFNSREDKIARSYLTAGQTERYARLSRPIRARQYLYSRVFYNQLINRLEATDYDEDFRPGLPHRPIQTKTGPVYTSLTHSDHYFALALSRFAVAVDMEVMVERDFKNLAPLFNHPNHRNEELADADAFYRAWCEAECREKLHLASIDEKQYRMLSEKLRADSPVRLCALYDARESARVIRLDNILTDQWERQL